MKFKKVTVLGVLFVLLVVNNANTFAQCAMCKASAESDLNQGGSVAKELNTGILYLMTLPYLIIMVGGYFFFKKQVDAKVIAWKNKLKAWINKYFPRK